MNLIIITFVSWKSIERHHRQVLTGIARKNGFTYYRWRFWRSVDEWSKHSSKKKTVFGDGKRRGNVGVTFWKRSPASNNITKPIWKSPSEFRLNEAQRFGRSGTRVGSRKLDFLTWNPSWQHQERVNSSLYIKKI